MRDDQGQEEESVALPKTDGPLVKVTLHDGQQLYAVVKGQHREVDTSWWYLLQIHLPAATQRFGRLADEPSPVDFTAPASRCEPIEGQAYGQVPTERAGVAPAWKVEEPVYFGPERGPARIVHRGDCRAALERPDAAPCPLCRPDRPLRTAA